MKMNDTPAQCTKRNRSRQIAASFLTWCAVSNVLWACASLVSVNDSQPLVAGQALEPTKALRFPDRRPVLMVRTWNGSWSGKNPWGNSPRFRDENAGVAITKSLDNAYKKGWRRLMLLSPAGGPREAMLSKSLGEFWRRSPAWRRVMREQLGAWTRRHPDATLGIYMGLYLRGALAPAVADLETHLTPWLEMGVREFGFDATSPRENREVFNLASKWLRSKGARAVMEAYPIENGEIPTAYSTTTPMLALLRYANGRDPSHAWRFDPSRTEVWIGVGRGRPISKTQLLDLRERGYVFLVYSLEEQEREAALLIGSSGRRFSTNR